jgi:hypothetical protein
VSFASITLCGASQHVVVVMAAAAAAAVVVVVLLLTHPETFGYTLIQCIFISGRITAKVIVQRICGYLITEKFH